MTSVTNIDPDFDPIYDPNLQRFTRGRSERLAALETAPVLPQNFQPSSNTEMSWDGTGLDPNSYTWEISGSELDDIDKCCAEYTSSGRALHEIEKETFRLPSKLATQLAARRHDLHHGAGISLIRGLQPKTRTQRENFILFAGLASHLSEQRGRQRGNKYLVHVTDLTAGDDSKNYAAPYCNQQLPFHTDTGDVVAMFVFCSAAIGGDGTFAPVSTIYNKLTQSSPDLIPVLMQSDWPFDRPPDRSSREMFYKRPVLFLNDENQPEMVFSRGALIRSPRGQRPLSIPKITRVQCEALDAVHFAAVEAAHTIQYQEGDLLMFNNRRILHGRNAFADSGSAGQRHMLRLWLKDEEMAGKPANLALQRLWGDTFARGDEDERQERHWPSTPDPY